MNYPSREIAHGTPAARSLSTDIALEVRALWQGLTRECDAEGGHFDRQQFWVLAKLEDGPQRMTALAGLTQTSQTSLTGIVDRLESHGLVERVRSSEDRRVVEVSLTDPGRESLARARDAFLDRLESRLAPLGKKERDAFLRMLRVMNAQTAEAAKRD